MTTAIQPDAAIEDAPLELDEAAEALLRKFMPEGDKDAPKDKEPSEKKTDEEEDDRSKTDDKSEKDADKPSDKDEEKDEEQDEEAEDEEKTFADDKAFVKIKVNDEEREVALKDLTRLYGQEAALTKKSMEVAEQRKAWETKSAEQLATTSAILQRAKARWEPYATLDFGLLAAKVGSGEISQEEYTALRQSAQAAYDDVQFLEKHTQQFAQQLNEQRSNSLREQARETLKLLSGPVEKGGIEGWSEALYNDIRNWAVSKGAPLETVNQIVDPWAIHMMHNAMLFETSRSKKDGGRVEVTKVNKTPKKVTKSTTSPVETRKGGKEADAARAIARLQRSGSEDDAAAAIMGRWGVDA